MKRRPEEMLWLWSGSVPVYVRGDIHRIAQDGACLTCNGRHPSAPKLGQEKRNAQGGA